MEYITYTQIKGTTVTGPLKTQDWVTILLFEKGEGMHTIDFVDYQVHDLQIHLLFPGQIHKLYLEKNTQAHQLTVSSLFFETFPDSLPLLRHYHPVVNLSAGAYRKIFYEIRQLGRVRESTPSSGEIANMRLQLIALLTGIQAAKSSADPLFTYPAHPVIRKYMDLIEVYFKKQRSLSFYAQQLHISTNYLNVLCKQEMGRSALQLISERTVLEAKRWLITSDHSIKWIAYALAYKDVAYFSRFFKSSCGVSPRHFKMMYKKW